MRGQNFFLNGWEKVGKFDQNAGIFHKIDLATLAGAEWKNLSRSRIFGFRSAPAQPTGARSALQKIWSEFCSALYKTLLFPNHLKKFFDPLTHFYRVF